MTWQQLPDLKEEKQRKQLEVPYQVLALLVFVGTNLSVPFVINHIIDIDYHWYESLIKPSFTPPPWFFGQYTWVVLDLLIALSGWVLYVEGRFDGVRAFVYLMQYIFHLMWMPIFFAGQQLLLAFIDSVLQWFTLMCGIFMYRRINVWSSLLLVPALMWVSLAAAFNAALWYLNQK
jgi:benzodiazapine receptor